jgi:hypothetical protein
MGALVLHQPEPAVESLSASGLSAHMTKILNEKLQVSGFWQEPVLRTRDVYPGYEFFHPGSRAQKIPDPQHRQKDRLHK